MDETQIPAGAGTGFVWSEKGHIVTNYHVVQNGNEFLISFHNDKKTYKAKLIGVEPKRHRCTKIRKYTQQISGHKPWEFIQA